MKKTIKIIGCLAGGLLWTVIGCYLHVYSLKSGGRIHWASIYILAGLLIGWVIFEIKERGKA